MMSIFGSGAKKDMENHRLFLGIGRGFKKGTVHVPNILPSSNPLSFRVGDLREKTNNIKVTQNDSK